MWQHPTTPEGASGQTQAECDCPHPETCRSTGCFAEKKMQVGDKIKMDSEVQRYTIQACDGRFAVMTKPFNARCTYLYTIVDLKARVRGACDKLFGLNNDVDTPDGAQITLGELQSGELRVSRRNCVDLSEAEIAQMMA